jgi:hypothetical protein
MAPGDIGVDLILVRAIERAHVVDELEREAREPPHQVFGRLSPLKEAHQMVETDPVPLQADLSIAVLLEEVW